MNIPHCPAHGDTCMPMLRAGVWWCPRGEHLVIVPTVLAQRIHPKPVAA